MTLLPIWAINQETGVKTQLASCEAGHMFLSTIGYCPFCQRTKLMTKVNREMTELARALQAKLVQIESILANEKMPDKAITKIRETIT